MRQNESNWENIPGIMQLIEEGKEPSDLGGAEFIAPQFRSGGLVSTMLQPGQTRQLDRLWNWLRGFRQEQTLCERLPVWVPIAHLWPAPDGKLEFTYEASAQTELAAEITVYCVVGFGGASRRKLTSTVNLATKGKGLAYLTRAYLTIYRYRHHSSGEIMDRVDVDCAGEYGEFSQQELASTAHPFHLSPASSEDIKAKRLAITRIERCANSSAETDITLGQESLRSWKFELAPTVPMLDAPLSLAASCERASAFSAKFSLPAGRDYAFCVPEGQSPVVPVCVALAREET